VYPDASVSANFRCPRPELIKDVDAVTLARLIYTPT